MKNLNPSDLEVAKNLRALRRATANASGSNYAAKIALVPEQSVKVILGMLKSSGLSKWRPDVLHGASDSLYNQLHQQVFNKTLEATIVNFGYRYGYLTLFYETG